jgi:hypothetical protein
MNISFSFLKSQETIADLNKVVQEAQSPIKSHLKVNSGGDKFVARQGNNKEHPATSSEGLYTSYPLDTNSSLMPQTSDLLSNIQINNIKNKSVKVGNVFRDLGIEVL